MKGIQNTTNELMTRQNDKVQSQVQNPPCRTEKAMRSFWYLNKKLYLCANILQECVGQAT